MEAPFPPYLATTASTIAGVPRVVGATNSEKDSMALSPARSREFSQSVPEIFIRSFIKLSFIKTIVLQISNARNSKIFTVVGKRGWGSEGLDVIEYYETGSFREGRRRKIRKGDGRLGASRKTKTACYVKEDLCRWVLSSRFIVRQCRHNSETMPALRRLAGGEQNSACLFSSFPFSLPLSLLSRSCSLSRSLALSCFFCLLGTGRNDVGRKNRRNNRFIISGLRRRPQCRYCSSSFPAATRSAYQSRFGRDESRLL